MSEGVKVAKECELEYEKLKMDKKYHYITFKLDNQMETIVVEKTLDRGLCDSDVAYKRFLQELVETGDCRFAAFDVQWQHQLELKNDIVFFSWLPENSPMRNKMVYTSCKDYIKKALKPTTEVQGTTINEFDFEIVKAKIILGKKF
ncbi:uncharacterized protein LOC127714622 [Mytilus californianus]|uniref:uncharacterized protein LOC127714622 n=1 Tax=Mytilus californianus TaxID=6549 RepID=UPI002245ED4E|nr:uncharacterized protein LOC127714622 [Mytilus californianus]